MPVLECGYVPFFADVISIYSCILLFFRLKGKCPTHFLYPRFFSDPNISRNIVHTVQTSRFGRRKTDNFDTRGTASCLWYFGNTRSKSFQILLRASPRFTTIRSYENFIIKRIPSAWLLYLKCSEQMRAFVLTETQRKDATSLSQSVSKNKVRCI
jgi:hypothetical protein